MTLSSNRCCTPAPRLADAAPAAAWQRRSDHRLTASTDPINLDGGALKSMRGGSFLCHASYCDRYRCAARTGNDRRTSASNVGFRVVAARGERPGQGRTGP